MKRFLMLARMIWPVLAAMWLLTSAAFAAESTILSFSVRGKAIAQLSLADIRQKVPVTQIAVWEPHEDKTVTYEGFDAAKLFSALYGDQWKEIDEVLFTCADGYQPVLPVDRFKQYSGFLAYRRLDQDVFNVQNRFQNEKDVPLGPFYLNYPMSVTEYFPDEWMRKWLMDPRSVRYNSTMPGFASHPDPDKLADEVLAYLKVMAQNKQKPE